MKSVFLSISVLALLISSCNTKSDNQVDSPAQPMVAQAVQPAKVSYAGITDANTGATGLGVKPIDITPAEAMSRTMDFLQTASPFFVATLDNGLPRVRPTGVVTFFQDKIWFHVGQSKGVYKQISENPMVEIVSVGEGGGWIRISGEAVCVDDATVSNQALDSKPHLKNIYNEKSGLKLGNFYFKNAIVEISKADGTVETFKW